MRWEGSVYPKGRKWWLRFKDLSGRWVGKPTPFYLHVEGDREKADALLVHVREQLEAERRAGADGGPLTVRAWANTWIEKRRRLGIDAVREEEQRLRDHVFPSIGDLPLADVRRAHVRALMEAVREKPRKTRAKDAPTERLAPRTVLHVYRTLRQLFRAAVRAELLEANPVDLERDELPKKEDKDPTWRTEAVCTAAEVEALVSDPRIPEDRRVLYALEFLTGSRTGEAAAVRWHRYERGLRPLGKLTIARAYNTRRKVEKVPKTKRTRVVPVHPALAKILAEWHLAGFQRYTGRRPKDEDLVVPSATGQHRNVGYSLKCFHGDLARLGLRRRRHYDSRRTFVSLAQDGGAPKERVRWLTHTPGDQLDDYTSPGWDALCEAVLAIPVRLRGRAQIARVR
jgi:hypothetical protein